MYVILGAKVKYVYKYRYQYTPRATSNRKSLSSSWVLLSSWHTSPSLCDKVCLLSRAGVIIWSPGSCVVKDWFVGKPDVSDVYYRAPKGEILEALVGELWGKRLSELHPRVLSLEGALGCSSSSDAQTCLPNGKA